jgi:cell division septal protein FtsQ
MEIKTTNLAKTLESPDLGLAPDRSRYLRGKTPQKLRRSRGTSRFWLYGLKLLGILVVCLTTLGSMATLLVYAYSSKRFELRNISFAGCQHADPKKLEDIIRNSFPQHILKMNLNQVRERLEQEPWIRRVEIRRILPSEMAVYVYERTPAVILEIHEELVLTDEDGMVLDRYEPRYGKLDMPVFRGLLGESTEAYRLQQQENTDRVRLGLKMLGELESGSSAFPKSISEVNLSDKTNLRLLLVDDTAEIYLGDRDFLKRFRTLMANMKQYEDLKAQYKEFDWVDLRYEEQGQIIFHPRRNADALTNEPEEIRK